MEINNFYKILTENGFFVIKNLWDPKDLITEIPKLSGKYDYYGKKEKVVYTPEEGQVNGSTSRYNYPEYQEIHNNIRIKLETTLDIDLFNTYYFDRVYSYNQELKRHVDRGACELSVSLHIQSNLKEPWKFYILSKKNKEESLILNPGDGVVYLGCDVEHWRYPLNSRYSKFNKKIRNFLKKQDDTFYHQIFFHYVFADGKNVQYAFDRK